MTIGNIHSYSSSKLLPVFLKWFEFYALAHLQDVSAEIAHDVVEPDKMKQSPDEHCPIGLYSQPVISSSSLLAPIHLGQSKSGLLRPLELFSPVVRVRSLCLSANRSLVFLIASEKCDFLMAM